MCEQVSIPIRLPPRRGSLRLRGDESRRSADAISDHSTAVVRAVVVRAALVRTSVVGASDVRLTVLGSGLIGSCLRAASRRSGGCACFSVGPRSELQSACIHRVQCHGSAHCRRCRAHRCGSGVRARRPPPPPSHRLTRFAVRFNFPLSAALPTSGRGGIAFGTPRVRPPTGVGRHPRPRPRTVAPVKPVVAPEPGQR